VSQIEVYSFEDKDGNEFGTYRTQDPNRARDYARDNKLRVIANIYRFDESVACDDFTEKDEPETEDDDGETDEGGEGPA
jgi:hypothetical protein